MRRVFYNLFWMWQLEKEEQWLNEMANHGYLLVHPGKIRYEFDEVERGMNKVKIQFLTGSRYNKKNEDYFRFLEDVDIHFVGAVPMLGSCVCYFTYESSLEQSAIEFFSDIDSRIKYHRLMCVYMIIASIIIGLGSALNIYMAMLPNNFNRVLNGIVGGFSLAVAIRSIVYAIQEYLVIRRLKKERKIHE